MTGSAWIMKFIAAAKAALSSKSKRMNGIDISHNNGIVDWNRVAKQNVPVVDFAILKATEGATTVDKKFAINAEGCIKNGIRWGAYHFATWNMKDVVADARQEAAHFISRVKSVGKPDLPMVLDVETNKPLTLTRKEVLLFITTFVQELVAAGYDFALYSSPGFLNSYLPEDHNLGSWKLWLAHYTNKPEPRLPFGWKKYWIWQYTDKGQVKGVATLCDMNRSEVAI